VEGQASIRRVPKFPGIQFVAESKVADLLQLLFCDAKMHHMKKASVRDLRYRFSAVEDLLRDGEEIHITKRKRVIARLLPPESAAPAAFPDFLARQKKIFGKKRLKVSGAEQLAAERERF
jgi:antitoxin (DNA-binding transcriptional repressor) of toxin-antitoxin stability system